MAFRDMIEADISKVFFDVSAFGEIYRVENKEIAIVIDNDELKKRKSGQDYAVSESAVLLYARTEDLPVRRAAGESININGRECLVDSWEENMGVTTIVLHHNII